VIELGATGDRPVAGDWNGEGRDRPGIYRDGDTVVAAKSATTETAAKTSGE
jgi:hypothetical protein